MEQFLYKRYRVQPGDTLWQIAKEHGYAGKDYVIIYNWGSEGTHSNKEFRESFPNPNQIDYVHHGKPVDLLIPIREVVRDDPETIETMASSNRYRGEATPYSTELTVRALKLEWYQAVTESTEIVDLPGATLEIRTSIDVIIGLPLAVKGGKVTLENLEPTSGDRIVVSKREDSVVVSVFEGLALELGNRWGVASGPMRVRWTPGAGFDFSIRTSFQMKICGISYRVQCEVRQGMLTGALIFTINPDLPGRDEQVNTDKDASCKIPFELGIGSRLTFQWTLRPKTTKADVEEWNAEFSFEAAKITGYAVLSVGLVVAAAKAGASAGALFWEILKDVGMVLQRRFYPVIIILPPQMQMYETDYES